MKVSSHYKTIFLFNIKHSIFFTHLFFSHCSSDVPNFPFIFVPYFLVGADLRVGVEEAVLGMGIDGVALGVETVG